MRKSRDVIVGLLLGSAAGVIDVIPMVLQKLTWDANLAAFFHWVVVGFFIATTNLKINGALKGLFISFMALGPSAILIWWNDQSAMIPMIVSTIILGSVLGYLIQRFNK